VISIKVLMVTTTFPRQNNDTTPAFVYELSKHLKESGFEIVVLAPHDGSAKKLEIIDGMKIYRFPYFYPEEYQCLCYDGGMLPNVKKSTLAKVQLPIFIIAYIYFILKIIIKEKIDLVHAHWIIPSGFVCSLAKFILRKPLIISVHGTDIAIINYPFLKTTMKQILKSADICTVNSTATKNAVSGVFCGKKEPLIIPMGVDLDLFKPLERDKNYSVKEQVILTVARLDVKKGIHHLIDAMPAITRKFPGARLVIAGEGPERGHLMDQINKLGLEHNVSLAGAVQNKDLPKFYAMADIFILPSLREGLGVVLLEAMACGTPVIGSRVGGIPDIINDGENGLLAEPGDYEDIAKNIVRCLSDKELLRKFSITGLETVKERFAWGPIVEKFCNEYRMLEHGQIISNTN
jgi:N-acetyl-alpha-D-glucosaminyl L-malate synthase BshA